MASSIDKIPNSISGDGSSFVAQLKKALADFRSDVRDIDDGDTSAFCQPVTNVTLTQRKQGNDNFIDVSWNKESVYGYKEAFVFYRPISSSRWILSFNTEGTSGVIEGVQVGVRYAVKVVPHNIDGGYDKNPTDYFIDVVSSMETPTTPQQFFVNFDSGEGHWEWKYEGPYDFFELRTDTNVGVTNEYLLARTNRMEVFKEPNILQGTAYLYVRNNFGVYSVPATTTFNITEENKPPKPSISRGANGINIHMTPNDNYASYVVQVEELEYETDDNPFYLARTRGALRTRYRWKNGTAYSGWSNWIIVNISELIDTEDLADNCITSDKIASGSVTAGKLYAGNIDLAGNLAIVGGAVTLNENGLTCLDRDNDSVIFDNQGMRFVDSYGNEFSAIKRIVMGRAFNGRVVNFLKPFKSPPLIMCVPETLKVANATYSQTNLYQRVYASNVSTTGFKMNCYTTLDAGSKVTHEKNASVIVYPTRGGWVYDGGNWYHKDATTEFVSEIGEDTLANIEIQAHTSGSHDSNGDGDAHGLSATVVFYINNTQIFSRYNTGNGNPDNSSIQVNTTLQNINVPANAVFKILVRTGMNTSGNPNNYQYDYLVTVSASIGRIHYTTRGQTVVDEGTASFIAVDSGEYYSVE